MNEWFPVVPLAPMVSNGSKICSTHRHRVSVQRLEAGVTEMSRTCFHPHQELRVQGRGQACLVQAPRLRDGSHNT